jgi:cytochrome c oxidase assembly protein subunit 15
LTRHTYNPALHRIALLTAAATFPLIFMGGLVTSHGAGMSVPDWPNSYGYNMFTFPIAMWQGGIFYEHTHRLMGTVVGMLSIALTIWAWTTEPRRWVRWLATGVLGAVIFQGVLGGLRVVMVELDLAIVHACFAQAFFCLAALTAVVTSRWWIEAPDRAPCENVAATRRLFAFSAIAVGLIYLQLIVGAVMRHYEAGLAIPDFPTSYGGVLPPTSAAQLAKANGHRTYDMHLPPVTMAQVWLHFAHRLGAILVSAAVVTAVTLALRQRRRTRWEPIVGAFLAAFAGFVGLGAADAVGSTRGWIAGIPVLSMAVVAFFVCRAFLRRMRESRPLLAPAVLVAAMLLVQVILGILTVLLRKPADVASAHVAVGALTLVTMFALAVRAWRLASVSTTDDAEPSHVSTRTTTINDNNDHATQKEPVFAE